MLLLDKSQCTYCGACIQICPKHCINVVEDKTGFRYPVVNVDYCIHCGKCNSVCPIEKQFQTQIGNSYAAVNKHVDTMTEASSGGLFGAIATYILEKGGVVYGCAFIDGLKAKHIRIDTVDSISLLYGSKYVQSDTGDSFIAAKKDLNDGKWVVFSGTPCQIAGLRSFLGREYNKLILIDIICHGVPSQAYFDKYINWLEKKESGRIRDFQFRSKNNHGWSLAGEFVVENDNYEEKKPLYYFNHFYYFYFLEASIYRECCYSCKYANLNRLGDFTLGDFWGAESLNLSFDIKKGCSIVLVNSKKAERIIEDLDISKEEISIEIATKYNEQLTQPSKLRNDRDIRLKEFQNITADEIQRIFIEKNKVGRLKGIIKYSMPSSLKQVINKIRFRLESQS